MDAIEGLDRRITVLIIAHRLSTIENCDRVVMLEKGHIIGIGSYRQLEAENKAFQLLAGHHDLSN
jgi:ABC-type multidrug transport system fused ATPase/permease subunit